MNLFFFWKQWTGTQKKVYQFLLILFVIVVAFFGYSFIQGPAAVIHWDTVSVSNRFTHPVETFNLGLFSLSFQGDHYLVDEHFRGSDLYINKTAAYIFLTVLIFCLAVLLAVITFLSRFWYYAAILLVAGFLVTCQFEQLFLFGSGDSLALIIALVLFLLPLYYFNAINPRHGFNSRLLVFLACFVIFGLIIGLFHGTANAALVVANYGIAGPLVLSILFIILVAHYLISFFLQIITTGNSLSSKNSLIHFSVISIIYLVNVFFVYLKNTGVINWDLIYINSFILLLISTLAGIWSFRQQEEVYGNIVPFRPLGAYLYLALAALTFATISYLMATANDPVLETLEDAIIYTHLGFGFLFFLYILVNFYGLLILNKQVHKVIYSPPNFPYATYQIAGFVAVIAFFLKSNMFPFYQAVAGYYIGLGDVYMVNQELFTAEQYYKLSNQYEFQNHRSNYALGSLARQQQDEGLTAFYFQQALLKSPTPFAYINLSQAYQENGRFFDALFNLKEGLETFPGNAYIQNNLALLYAKTSILDSAIYLLDQARADSRTDRTAETNLLALTNRHFPTLGISSDSALNELFTHQNYLPAKANALALVSQFSTKSDSLLPVFQAPTLPKDSALDNFMFTYRNNYLLNSIENPDSSVLNETKRIAELPANFSFSESLLLSEAVALYQDLRVTEAFYLLDRLQTGNLLRSGYYNNLLGTWALQQHAPLVAERFFKKASDSGLPESELNLAIAITESLFQKPDRIDAAVETWQQILKKDSTETTSLQSLAKTMVAVLTATETSQITARNDDFKYQVLRFRSHMFSAEQVGEILSSNHDVSFKAMALLDLADRFPGKSEVVTQFTAVLSDNSLSALAINRIQWRNATRLAAAKKDQELKKLLSQLHPASYQDKSNKLLVSAMLAEQQGNEAYAKLYFTRLLDNPFFVKGFLAAIDYFSRQEISSTFLYDKLLSAIEINSPSSDLLKKYILTALEMGLQNYASEALFNLEEMISAKDYQLFKEKYDQKSKEMEVF